MTGFISADASQPTNTQFHCSWGLMPAHQHTVPLLEYLQEETNSTELLLLPSDGMAGFISRINRKDTLPPSISMTIICFFPVLLVHKCLLLQDLRRAGLQYASAVFVIAPKHDNEPTLADRQTLMMVLTVGQFLQVRLAR
jgi:hypothetical protein